MTPEEGKLLQTIIDAQRNTSEHVMDLLAANGVLTAACGALFAELARVAGSEGEFEKMLTRLTAVIEGDSDRGGRVLKAADSLRSAAEAMAEDLDVR